MSTSIGMRIKTIQNYWNEPNGYIKTIHNQAERARDIFLKAMEMTRPAMFFGVFPTFNLTKAGDINCLK